MGYVTFVSPRSLALQLAYLRSCEVVPELVMVTLRSGVDALVEPAPVPGGRAGVGSGDRQVLTWSWPACSSPSAPTRCSRILAVRDSHAKSSATEP